MRNFKSLNAITNALTVLFVLHVGVGVLFAISAALMVFTPENGWDLGNGIRANAGLVIIPSIALIETLLRLATFVVFLIWEYRAFANLRELQIDGAEYSPWMSLVWWIVPFANLIMPCRVVNNLWNSSEPEAAVSFGSYRGDGGISGLVVVWWVSFLIRGIAAWVANGLVNQIGQVAPEFPHALAATGVFSAVSAVLALLIVRRISARQDALSAAVRPAEPPPPPTFGSGEQ